MDNYLPKSYGVSCCNLLSFHQKFVRHCKISNKIVIIFKFIGIGTTLFQGIYVSLQQSSKTYEDITY